MIGAVRSKKEFVFFNAKKTRIASVVKPAVPMDVDVYARSPGQASMFEHLKIFQDRRF